MLDPPGSVQADARKLLNMRAYTVKEIIDVQVDCILYVDGMGLPMTAWTTVLPHDSAAPKVVVERGFCAVRGALFDHEKPSLSDRVR